MFLYEWYNYTLSTAITNNQHPEISAIKTIETEWLVTMLYSAGFMELLLSTNKNILEYEAGKDMIEILVNRWIYCPGK